MIDEYFCFTSWCRSGTVKLEAISHRSGTDTNVRPVGQRFSGFCRLEHVVLLIADWYETLRSFVEREAARDRVFLTTTGRKSNRWLRIADASTPQG